MEDWHKKIYQGFSKAARACWRGGNDFIFDNVEHHAVNPPPLPDHLKRLLVCYPGLKAPPDVTSCKDLEQYVLTTIYNRPCSARRGMIQETTDSGKMDDVSGYSVGEHYSTLTVSSDMSQCLKLKKFCLLLHPDVTLAPVVASPLLETYDIRGCHNIANFPDLRGKPNLKSVKITGTAISAIPQHVFELPRDCVVELNFNRFSPTVRSELDAILRGPGYSGPRFEYENVQERTIRVLPLTTEITSWLLENFEKYTRSEKITQDAKDEAEVLASDYTDPRDKDVLSEFLNRARDAKEYNIPNVKNNFADRIVQLLRDLHGSEQLRQVCIHHADNALKKCGDRVAFSLIDMETSVVAHKALLEIQAGKHDLDPRPVFELGRKLAEMEAVRAHSAAKVASLNLVDPIEVFLGAHIHFCESYNFPVKMKSMIYPALTHVLDDPAYVAGMKKTLDMYEKHESEDLFNFYASWDCMMELLKRNRPSRLKEINDHIDELTQSKRSGAYRILEGMDENSPDYAESAANLNKELGAACSEVERSGKIPLVKEYMKSHGVQGIS